MISHHFSHVELVTCNPRSLSTPGGGWIPIKENLLEWWRFARKHWESSQVRTSWRLVGINGTQYLHPHLLHSGYALDWCGLRFRIYLSPVILFKLRFSNLSRKKHPKEATFSNSMQHIPTTAKLSTRCPYPKKSRLGYPSKVPGSPICITSQWLNPTCCLGSARHCDANRQSVFS